MRKICKNCVDYDPETSTCKIKYHYVRGERFPEPTPYNMSGCKFFFPDTKKVDTCGECMDFNPKRDMCKSRVGDDGFPLRRLPRTISCSVFIRRIK